MKKINLSNRKVQLVIVLLLVMVSLTGCISSDTYSSAITFEGSWFSKYIVYPVGWMLYTLTEISGGSFAIGVLLTTLIIRSLAWPVYAKSLDTSQQQQQLQPEIEKVQKKYAGKTDTRSQTQMQQEVQQVYKDNGVSMFGCLMPFLQLPIFMAVYSAVIRMPNNLLADGVTLVFGESSQVIDPTIFGYDLLVKVNTMISAGEYAYIVIPLITAASMLLVQFIQQKRAKAKQEDVPDYRKPKNDAGKQMRSMMIFMTIFMGYITYTSVAMLGFYWIIGNMYSLLQNEVNHRLKKQKKAKEDRIV